MCPAEGNVISKGDLDKRGVKARGRLGRGDWGMDQAKELGLNWWGVGVWNREPQRVSQRGYGRIVLEQERMVTSSNPEVPQSVRDSRRWTPLFPLG